MEEVKVWVEQVQIPTYQAGEKNKNPMFLEKRIYQGSSGKVYPYPVIDKIYDDKVMKTYKIVFLENEYIQIQVMPEVGGRIYRALDKTNNYDFVYYNRVMKPALVGLTGPWVSGGIEFNWPQHHRPNTFGDVEFDTIKNNDGSKSIIVGEIDRMYGTKVTTTFTLYPDKSYIEIHAQLYNRTSEPQTFLWWANPAVKVHDDTQSIFPPDVHAVFDHGKRDVSRFPIATGVYYKHDYSSGVDISRYKNIPVPTSYMAYHSDFNFVGGYDYAEKAGLLHIANHHISPGKKQWTWGNGDFGKAWDRNLTDEDGPYIELMTGVYTDNQPDFTWLMPYEEKEFTQYFMPYKGVGQVKNATTCAVCGLEVHDNLATVTVYATGLYKNATIMLSSEGDTFINEMTLLSPYKVFEKTVPISCPEKELHLQVLSESGYTLVAYTPVGNELVEIPSAAKAIDKPSDILNNEGLYLAGLHLEQYRHATYAPEDYYLEGLKRDVSDIRINNAYGKLLMKRADFENAERHFRTAVKTITRHNTNPYDGESHFNLGKCLKYQGKLSEAYTALFKATWSGNTASAAYFLLAQIAAIQKDYNEALTLVEKCLNKDACNRKGLNLKTALLRKTGQLEEAAEFANVTITSDRMDFCAYFETYLIGIENGGEQIPEQHKFFALMRGDVKNILALAYDYIDFGGYEEASLLLDISIKSTNDPMSCYTYAYVAAMQGDENKMHDMLAKAANACPDYCFPNTLHDYLVLTSAIRQNETDSKAHYYLGNLLYDKKRYNEAITHWERSIQLDDTFPTTFRNLALAYFNKRQEKDFALIMLEKAFQLNQNDSRVFYELDQLHKKLGYSAKKRVENLEQHMNLVEDRDDLFTEYLTLKNLTGEHEATLSLIAGRRFHPWEGGEGKVPAQYIIANVEIAKQLMKDNKQNEALCYLEAAKTYPQNIGEGKLLGAQENNINYYLGCAYQQMNETEKANQHFLLASVGLDEPASAMFYNDQPPHMIYFQGLALLRLGEKAKAASKFNKLISYGEKHFFEEQHIDYFAVSLPDFLVFEEDLNRKNKIHCLYMMQLGHMGLGNMEEANKCQRELVALDPNHHAFL